MNRLLNRRDKDGNMHRRQKSRDKKIRPLSGDSVWGFFKSSSHKKQDQENTNSVAVIKQKLLDVGHLNPADELINFALASDYANGNPEKAYDILILFQESVDGLIHPCNPNIQLVGAINRNNVTCYIDSVLFAMLGVVHSYDLIFCGAFENDAQRLLSRIVLLYANMLRAGKLIHLDLTKNLQEALAACGWDCDPAEQQDASEFYGFIARTLNVPLLSIESNIFHHATPDECHDHRIIEEQVLNVSIPDVEEGQLLPLERCLEEFLNNKVEITRSLPRIDPFSSIRPDIDEGMLCRLETSMSTPSVPISSPLSGSPKLSKLERSQSTEEGFQRKAPSKSARQPVFSHSTREGSARKDVRILAWQFFNILPWHRKNSVPTTKIETQADIEKTAPTLAICLKRYGFKDGQPYRKNTPIDIPEEMLLPHPIENDVIDDHCRAQEFKLVLMAVVCHRGKSLNEGHYTALVRRSPPTVDGDSNSSRRLSDASQPPNYSENQWYKFDDLADPRVFPVKFQEAIFEEMPYLLFYQVQPRLLPVYTTPECTKSEQQPPSYDSGLALTISVSHPSDENESSSTSYVDCTNSQASSPVDTEPQDFTTTQNNSNISTGSPNEPLTVRYVSVFNLDSSDANYNSESTKARISKAASRFSKSNLRPSSQSGESRIGVTISRLNIMRSKEQLSKSETAKDRRSNEENTEAQSTLSAGQPMLNPSEDIDDQPKKKKKKPPKFRRAENDIAEEKSETKDPDRECIIM
ncbi:hypothetical protein K3495_g4449 [Podosphaera aphanis]|nr:hypothetical protein K3495_g4449 [Podosphaera aphanis]